MNKTTNERQHNFVADGDCNGTNSTDYVCIVSDSALQNGTILKQSTLKSCIDECEIRNPRNPKCSEL